MKHTKFVFLLLFLGAISINRISATNNLKKMSKEKMMSEIKSTYDQASFHSVAIKRIGQHAYKSKNNFQNFVIYTELASRIEMRTKLFIHIAKKTKRLKKENEVLIEVAKLVGNSNVSTNEIKRLTRKALHANTEEKRQSFEKLIKSYEKQLGAQIR
ncbi:hypothetical protein [Labilibaculum euxinus]